MKEYIITADSQERLANSIPRGKPSKKDLKWCPYCSQWSKWVEDKNGYDRAECCGISDSDFWVKTHNKLWDKGLKVTKKKSSSTKYDDDVILDKDDE